MGRLRAVLLGLPRPLCAALVVLYAGGIFDLSSRTLPAGPAPWFGYFTNLAHAPLFGGFAVLLGLTLWPRQGGAALVPPRLLTAWVLAVLYAISDEIHQSFTPGRSASAVDVMTDALGAALALLILRRVLAPEIRARAWHYASLVTAILVSALIAWKEPW
jgi:hypothetical protein